MTRREEYSCIQLHNTTLQQCCLFAVATSLQPNTPITPVSTLFSRCQSGDDDDDVGAAPAKEEMIARKVRARFTPCKHAGMHENESNNSYFVIRVTFDFPEREAKFSVCVGLFRCVDVCVYVLVCM